MEKARMRASEEGIFHFSNSRNPFETTFIALRCLKILARCQWHGLNLARPVASSDAGGEINCHPALHAREEALDRFHRVHIMPSDSVNHQAALNPNFRCRTSRLNRANQNSAPGNQA